MRGVGLRIVRALGEAGIVLAVLSAGLLILWGLAGLSWLVEWTAPPERLAGPAVALDDYGVPGVSLRLVYPAALEPGAPAGAVTVLARAATPEDVQAFELALVLEDAALAFVGPDGLPTAGRLAVTPGYPDALPHTLRLAHAGTQLGGGLVLARTVAIVPALLDGAGAAEGIPEAAFAVDVPGRLPGAARALLTGVGRALAPYLVAGSVLLTMAWAVGRYLAERRRRTGAALTSVYETLQEHIKAQRWIEARQAIEQIRAIAPGYRDVPLLDTRVREEEAASWRREHLFHEGVEAYRQRNWRAAAHVFAIIEREDPYYRDVRFLHRTAMLYADLRSRDRSRRVGAARQLGEVGDLVEWAPLLEALGDHAEQVADAAEQAFQRIGPEAFDVLLGGLRAPEEAVRARAMRLLKGYGQAVRERLLAALRSSDPAITAPVARLLAEFGARRELAEALLWAGEPHLEGIVAALVDEGVVASAVLLETLLRAGPDREPVVLRAIAALKARADITRQIEEAYRAARSREDRERIERALDAPAAPYATPTSMARTAPDAGDAAVEESADEPSHEEGAEDAAPERGRWLRLFDRRSA